MIFCSASKSYDVGIRRYEAIKNLLDKDPRGFFYYNLEEGTIKAFIDESRNEIAEVAKSIFKTIRWRYNLYCGNDWMFNNSLDISLDGLKWSFIIDTKFSAVLSRPINIKVKEINNCIKDNEPIYNELWHEAYELRLKNPRSSLLIATVALETAIKQFISFRISKAEWLIDNIPSPPIEKILKEYMPLIEKEFYLPESYIDSMKSMIFERNKLIHVGKEPNYKLLESRLKIVKDMLLIIDFFMGKKWSALHLSEDYINKIK